MRKKRCPKCSIELHRNTLLSKDGAQIISAWLCPGCLHRFTTLSANPRYKPIPADQTKKLED